MVVNDNREATKSNLCYFAKGNFANNAVQCLQRLGAENIRLICHAGKAYVLRYIEEAEQIMSVSLLSATSTMKNAATEKPVQLQNRSSSANIHVRRSTCYYSNQNEELTKLNDGGEESAQTEACVYAQDQYQDDFQGSSIKDQTETFPRFSCLEVVKGSVLGKGGFGVVSQVDAFQVETGPADLNITLKARIHAMHDPATSATILPDSECPDHSESSYEGDNHDEVRKFIVRHCHRQSGDARYAVKELKADVVADPDKLYQGLLDLNLETRMLCSLPHHPNIIKIRAIAEGNRFSPDYFIVLDRLYDTLETRVITWRKELLPVNQRGSAFSSCCLGTAWKAAHSNDEDSYTLQHTLDRLWMAYDLASALAHLHGHRIIHRDLKPANIGFDIRDDIKIFDLGLAKEIPQDGTNGPWHLTSMCGSPRYMAPEVATGKPYTSSCDAYSFALLLWEMMTLCKPYNNITIDSLHGQVWNDSVQLRPSLDDHNLVLASTDIRTLLTKAWSSHSSERPAMLEVEATLKGDVSERLGFLEHSAGGNGRGTRLERLYSKRLTHNARRSTFLFDGSDRKHPSTVNLSASLKC